MSGKQSILICDDDEPMRRLIATILAATGYAVTQTVDVASAIGAVNASPPDLVVLDFHIPGEGGGLSVLHHIRADPVLRNVAVLLVSGVVEAMSDDWGRGLGADGHLLKPFELDEFRSTVRDLLPSRPAA